MPNASTLFTLSLAIAKRIKGGQSRIAEEVPNVSVLFADLVGFTAMSTKVNVKHHCKSGILPLGMRLEAASTAQFHHLGWSPSHES